MTPLRVVVVGARGRMGRFACELLRASPDFELAAELDREHRLEAVLPECRAELALDLTVAGLGYEHGLASLRANLRPVIGTSGVSRGETARLDQAARERGLGGLVVPNFSLGMWCLQRAALEIARHFPRVEIIEEHHQHKRDSPSGTARDTAERLAAALQRPAQDFLIHSLRLPGLFAHQELRFGGPGETLTLRHDMLGPEGFGPGILLALRHASRAVGVGHGLEMALAGERQPGPSGP